MTQGRLGTTGYTYDRLRICLTGGRHNGQHLHDMDLDGLRIY